MKKVIALIIVLGIILSLVPASADLPYIGIWVSTHDFSEESTSFIMFEIREDHTALYISQFFYQDHAGMTEKGVWPWEKITDTIFRILPDDGRMLYFELIDPDHLSAGSDIIYTRHVQEE